MENLISQFVDITGVTRERAEFYLLSSTGRLEVALANFYEVESTDEAPENIPDEMPNVQGEVSNPEVSESAVKKIDSKPKKSKSTTNARFGTLASLQNQDSSSDEEGQAFYAGGSTHSGQQVLGPSKKKHDILNDMFKTCQEQSIPMDERSQPQQRPCTFGGTGYKLGQTSNDTEVIPAEGAAAQSGQASNTGLITLKLWRDGFTINDRELRSYSDPQNREFMEAIKRSEIPIELRQEVQEAEVRLDMEDHRFEEYVPSKPKVKAFAGRGHKLGSPSPATVGMTVPSDSADQAANESQARSELSLNPNSPMTTIQIRLADGQSIREQFNLSHTVGDIRRFIRTMRPQYENQDFVLMTSYPSKELLDETVTIDGAGLKNSALMQRL